MSQSDEIIESLLARVQALEARLNDLCPQPNPSRVTPEGMPTFDVKKRIDVLETRHGDENTQPYYHGWVTASVKNYGEFKVNDICIKKEYGPAMFDGIYYQIPQMISLNKLTMISSNGTVFDYGLSLLPDISKIRNYSVKEMKICGGFEFIPYLENFPALLRLEIVDHPLRPKNEEKMQNIRDYCAANGITALC